MCAKSPARNCSVLSCSGEEHVLVVDTCARVSSSTSQTKKCGNQAQRARTLRSRPAGHSWLVPGLARCRAPTAAPPRCIPAPRPWVGDSPDPTAPPRRPDRRRTEAGQPQVGHSKRRKRTPISTRHRAARWRPRGRHCGDGSRHCGDGSSGSKRSKWREMRIHMMSHDDVEVIVPRRLGPWPGRPGCLKTRIGHTIGSQAPISIQQAWALS